MNRRPSSDGPSPVKRPESPDRLPLPRPLTHKGGEPLLRRLADQIRMTRASELLVGLRKHFANKTALPTVLFPRRTLRR
jgi:hypothetical protein